MNKIRILLADDHTLVRKGIRSLLDAEEDIEVIGEAINGRDAVDQATRLHPDIVLMDITMPQLNGLEASRQILKASPQTKIIILSMYTNEEYIFQSLRVGVAGYLIKEAVVEELIFAIRSVYQGGSFLSPSVSGLVIDEFRRQSISESQIDPYETLTDREREVLHLIAEGKSNREISDLLCLTVKTVEVHRSRLMEKLGIHGVADLTRYAIRKGLISPDR